MGSKRRRLKSRKERKFHGNRFTNGSVTIESADAMDDPLCNSKHQEKIDDEHPKAQGHVDRPTLGLA